MNLDRYRSVEDALWASLDIQPTEREVPLHALGTTVRVLEIGRGPTVVFIHGGSASGANWAPLVAALDGFRCILVDRPGCGLSKPIDRDLSDLDRFEEFANLLVADIIDGLGETSAHVVATSLGGHFALRGAATHPERVRRMVEFGFVPGAPLTKVPFSMRLAMIPGLGRLMVSIPPTRGAVRAILRQLGMGAALKDGRISDEMFDWFHALLRDTRTMRNESTLPRGLIGTAGDGSSSLPDELLARIACPVRFAWGETDPIGGADVARSFVPRIPGAELELWADTGHAPWMEDPARAASTVADFLNR